MRLSLYANHHSFAPASQVAVARLHLPDGTIYHNQVVVIDEEGKVINYAPLQAECAFTTWFKGDAYLRSLCDGM